MEAATTEGDGGGNNGGRRGKTRSHRELDRLLHLRGVGGRPRDLEQRDRRLGAEDERHGWGSHGN
eukprot:93506-Hanusia_phi.AAC.1